jgi:hypothetical protein
VNSKLKPNKNTKIDKRLLFWGTVFLVLIGGLSFLMAAVGGAGHSRMTYDLGRWCGFASGLALFYLFFRGRNLIPDYALITLFPFILFSLIFFFVTYKEIPFYSISGILEIFG